MLTNNIVMILVGINKKKEVGEIQKEVITNSFCTNPAMKIYR